MAEWIKQDHVDQLGEQGREQFDLLLGRVKRMNNLKEGILTYSRVRCSQEKAGEIDPGEILEEVVDSLAPPDFIQVTIEKGFPALVAERTRIFQLFQNLLSNAIKFMDKPAGMIEVGFIQSNGAGEFFVRDNGPGIEERYFEKIFLLFQLLDARDDVERTGVGLSVVQKIVEMYSGSIRVQSRLGEGTTFFFTLPQAGTGGTAK